MEAWVSVRSRALQTRSQACLGQAVEEVLEEVREGLQGAEEEALAGAEEATQGQVKGMATSRREASLAAGNMRLEALVDKGLGRGQLLGRLEEVRARDQYLGSRRINSL